jgi:exopolysaccharide biosynthesis polyprenyl glycosylphosphotransferase
VARQGEEHHLIRRHAAALRIALVCFDGLVAVLVLGLAGIFRFGTSAPLDPLIGAIPNPLVALLMYAIGWPLSLWSQGLYRTRARWTIRGEVSDIVRATVLFAAVILSALFLARLPDVSRGVLLIVFPALAASALATRLAMRLSLNALRRNGRNTRFVLVLGTNAGAQRFANMIESQPVLGLRILGHLDAGNEVSAVSRPILGSIDQIESILHTQIVDEVAICLPINQWGQIDEITRLCEQEGKIVRIPMYVLEHSLAAGRVEEIGGVPIYSIVSGPDRVIGLIIKRTVDLVLSTVLLVALSPLLLLIALAIRLQSPGPVLFTQRRVGLNGRVFEVVKFRTMVAGAEAQLAELLDRNEIEGHAFKLTDDPRITPVGTWLRRTSLDELPQLWNVAWGQMSLVGPRPPLLAEVVGYDVWHRRRLSMKPGITGLWQVGSRREQSFDRWVEADLDYIDHWSLWLDLKILFLTIPAVVGRQGR